MTGSDPFPDISAVAWQSEFVLDAAIVERLLQSQFPGLPITSVEYLHEGWDNAAFLVNEKWVFRFPKRRERQAWFESEIAVLKLLATRQLALSVPVPEYVGRPSPVYPCGFMGYRLIPGTQGTEWGSVPSCLGGPQRGIVQTKESARRLGNLLTVLHSIDVHEAAAQGVQTYESPLHELLAETVAMRELVWPSLPESVKHQSRSLIEDACAVPERSTPRQCLAHSDLMDEHILLDETGCVSGVIDWGDSCLTDPAIDFSGLYAWLGEAFVRQVLEHYTLPSEASFLEQIAFRARCVALIEYGHALDGRATTKTNRLPMVCTAFGVAAT